MLVDDFFFVVSSFLTRSISTLDFASLRNIIEYICIITEKSYLDRVTLQISKLIPRVSNQDVLQALVSMSIHTPSSYGCVVHALTAMKTELV